MSNSNYAGRSNRVKVKDLEGLKKSLKQFDWLSLFEEDGKYYISADDYDPFFQTAYLEDVEIEFDPQIHIIPYLEDKEILIIMEVSNEKLQYIYGAAYAYMKGKTRICVNLDHIHRMIEQQWNTNEYDSF